MGAQAQLQPSRARAVAAEVEACTAAGAGALERCSWAPLGATPAAAAPVARVGGRSPARPPPPPAAGSSPPSPASRYPSARPPNPQPGPAEPGGLSGRRRLSATQVSRGARRPGTSTTPQTPLCRLRPIVAGTHRATPLGPRFDSLRPGEERRKPDGCSGIQRTEAAAPEASGWRRRRRRREVRVTPGRRVSPPGRGCGCQLHKSGGGGRWDSRGSLAMERGSGPGDTRSSAWSLWTPV